MKKLFLGLIALSSMSMVADNSNQRTSDFGGSFKIYQNQTTPYIGKMDTGSIMLPRSMEISACPNGPGKCLYWKDWKDGALEPIWKQLPSSQDGNDGIPFYARYNKNGEFIVSTDIKLPSGKQIQDNDPALVLCDRLPNCTGIKYPNPAQVTSNNKGWEVEYGRARSGYVSAVLVTRPEGELTTKNSDGWISLMEVPLCQTSLKQLISTDNEQTSKTKLFINNYQIQKYIDRVRFKNEDDDPNYKQSYYSRINSIGSEISNSKSSNDFPQINQKIIDLKNQVCSEQIAPDKRAKKIIEPRELR